MIREPIGSDDVDAKTQKRLSDDRICTLYLVPVDSPCVVAEIPGCVSVQRTAQHTISENWEMNEWMDKDSSGTGISRTIL